jgi:hypothetical protein
MHRVGLAEADFLSLDVEGAEVKVLRTVDPAQFKTVLVETSIGYAAENVAKNAAVDALLTRGGLVRVPRLGNRVNHAYVRRDVLVRCSHAVNLTCRNIQRSYKLPQLNCDKHSDFVDGSTLPRG